MKLTPSRRLLVFGATLLVALTICARKFSNVGEPSFIISMGVAGIAYLFAVRELFSTPKFPQRVIVIGLVFAAAWHVPFLLKPPGLDDDIHRYLWDGRVQRLGYNPYVVVPERPGARRTAHARNAHDEQPAFTKPISAGRGAIFSRGDGDA